MTAPEQKAVARTREQQILARISGQPVSEWSKLVPRAESLPAMLIRHGVLPVKLFLAGKDQDAGDQELWALVEAGIESVLPGYTSGLDEMTKLSLERYFLLQEVAIESATLVSRWAKLKARERASKAASGGMTP
jgi:hypothetical protein